MTLTKKEQGLLKDLQHEEKLCAEKYHRAAEAACDPHLKSLFQHGSRLRSFVFFQFIQFITSCPRRQSPIMLLPF